MGAHKEERLVYRDFFAFTAVAWFTTGVISPLTLPIGQGIPIHVPIVAAVATFLSLRAATMFAAWKYE